jgi:hypothetical protein
LQISDTRASDSDVNALFCDPESFEPAETGTVASNVRLRIIRLPVSSIFSTAVQKETPLRGVSVLPSSCAVLAQPGMSSFSPISPGSDSVVLAEFHPDFPETARRSQGIYPEAS